MPRHSAKNPAPKRCATCTFCKAADNATGRCTAPVPAWVVEAFNTSETEALMVPIVDTTNYRDPKCPLWSARGPTTH